MPKKGYKQTEEHRRKVVGALRRWAAKPGSRELICIAHRGKNNARWKGDEAGYVAIHLWVNRWFGKPSKCEKCGKDGLKGQQIHWSNVSGEYERERSDWQRLCQPCHSKFDLSWERIGLIKRGIEPIFEHRDWVSR